MLAGPPAPKSASKEQEEINPAAWMASCNDDAWSWRRTSSADNSRTLDHRPQERKTFGDTAGQEGGDGRWSLEQRTYDSLAFQSFCEKKNIISRASFVRSSRERSMRLRLRYDSLAPPPPRVVTACQVRLCACTFTFCDLGARKMTPCCSCIHCCKACYPALYAKLRVRATPWMVFFFRPRL